MAEELKHSRWGASKFESIMLCPGKTVLEAGLPNTTSKYAAEGTAAHQVLTWALQESMPAMAYIGRVIEVDGFTFTVDDDMAGHVQTTIDYVYDLTGDKGQMFVDTKVNYANFLNVPEQDAWGTADVVILRDDEIIVMDFKYGMGVEVDAGHNLRSGHPDGHGDAYDPNPQLALYALGALNEYGLLIDFKTARLAISQPRLKAAPSEYDMPVQALIDWADLRAVQAVGSANTALMLSNDGADFSMLLIPGEKQCKFCKAKATCPALRDEVSESVHAVKAATPEEFTDFLVAPLVPLVSDNAAWLAASLGKVDLIEDWCKAIRGEAERILLGGGNVPGYKVVQGKRGARAWSDPAAAEELLHKVFRLPVEKAYDLKLISPTTAEKLAKAGDIGPRQWPKAKALIVQPDGKLHVAPVSDSRPAIEVKPVTEDFSDLEPLA